MKISLNWLKTYLNFDLTNQEIEEILTSTGLEVESITKAEAIKGGLEGVVVGEVLTCEKHPDADKLKLTSVSIGQVEPLKIVCGAPNVAVGQKVLVATVGATLYPISGEAIKIKKSKIRGQESEGMICAEDELGLGESHEGILVLDPKTPAGVQAKSLLNLEDDYLIEIGLTPNRTDAMSHVGVARDLKAFLNFHRKLNLQLQLPDTSIPAIKNTLPNFKVSVTDTEKCPRYAGAIIQNVQVKESPEWLQKRLKSIGLKPINNIVDVTNFVMHEFGNPLHAFDLNVVGNEVVVRNAREGEKLTTLDQVDRELNSDDLVICNATSPMCIAGVMGGSESGIKESSKAIFLEAAFFQPSTVRRTSKRHVLNSDSSFRFERGADPNRVIEARDRAINLILSVAGGELTFTNDHYPAPLKPKTVAFSLSNCKKLTGINCSDSEIEMVLRELDFEFVSSSSGMLQVSVPTYRHDVNRQADLAEEFLRIYGFNQVPLPDKLNSSITYAVKPDREKYYNLIADTLVNSGYSEIMNNSLTSSLELANDQFLVQSETAAVKILNPLSNELDVLRQNLIPGVLRVVEYNQNRQRTEQKLFEFGTVYTVQENNYTEERRLVLAIAGNRLAETWQQASRKADFFTLKSVIEKLLEKLGIAQFVSFEKTSFKLFSDALELKLKNKSVGIFGKIRPSVLKDLKIKGDVFAAELNWDQLLKAAASVKAEFQPIPKTQFVRRDFSLLLDTNVEFELIEKLAYNTDKKLLKQVNLFDVYEGKNLPEGKKSYAVSFTFQDSERTLQDEQIDRIMQQIRLKLETELKAELR